MLGHVLVTYAKTTFVSAMSIITNEKLSAILYYFSITLLRYFSYINNTYWWFDFGCEVVQTCMGLASLIAASISLVFGVIIVEI